MKVDKEFRWSECYKLSIYNKKKGLIDDKISLSDNSGSNLSPYTNLILNSSLKLLNKKKNLMIVCPKISLKPTPLLGYLLADFFNCDVEVVTKKYNLENYIKTYCLLADDRRQGCYVFTSTPPLITKEECFKLYLYIPRATRFQKQKLKETTMRSLYNTNKILFTDTITIPKNPSKILVENKEKEELKIDLKPQIFLIENGLDYLRHYNLFVEWCNSAEESNFVVFINSLLNNKIENLAKDINSEVLYFPPSFFYSTRDIYKTYRDKIEKKKIYSTKNGWKILNKLNFDSSWDYDKPELEVISIKEFYELNEYLKEIRKDVYYIINNVQILGVRKLVKDIEWAAVKLIRSFLPPDKIKIYNIKENKILLLSDFIKNRVYYYLERINDPQLSLHIERIYKNFMRIYRNLSEVRHPHKGENLRDSKFITLLELLEKKDPQTKYYVLALYEPKKVLKEVILNFMKKIENFQKNIVVCNRHDIVKNFKIDNNSTLVLSTPLTDSFNYFFLLQLPFRKILFLLYKGVEEEKYFDDLKKIEMFELKKAIDSIHKIHKLMQAKPPKVFVKLFSKLVKEYGLSKYIKEIAEIKEEDLAKEKISEFYLPEIEQTEKVGMKRYKLTLKAKTNGEIKEIDCVYYKPILKLDKSSMVLEETTVAMLKEGDIVCLIDDDERKHMIDLISDSFIDEDVDVSLVKYWRIKLKKYIFDKEFSISDFYDIYKKKKIKINNNIKRYQTVRLWIHGNVLGPKDLDDLKVLAEIIEDDFLKKNYKEIYKEIKKVRKIHRIIGRKINKVVEGLLTSDFAGVTSFDEKILLSKLKLYDVLNLSEIT